MSRRSSEPSNGPATKAILSSDVRQNWSQVLSEVFREEIQLVIEKNGIPVAALISARDLERYRLLDAQRRDRFAALDRLREAFKDVPTEEIEREVAKAIAEVRAENRQHDDSESRQSA